MCVLVSRHTRFWVCFGVLVDSQGHFAGSVGSLERFWQCSLSYASNTSVNVVENEDYTYVDGSLC